MAGIEEQNHRPRNPAESCAEQAAHHLSQRELLWHPGSLDGEKAKHWQEGNSNTRHEKLKLNAGGNYKVTEFDTLSTIAERSLHAHGTTKPGRKALHEEMDRIVSLNKCEYPDLNKHRDFLPAGMELHIGHRTKSHKPHDTPDNRSEHLPPPRPRVESAPEDSEGQTPRRRAHRRADIDERSQFDGQGYPPQQQQFNVPPNYESRPRYEPQQAYAQRPQQDIGQGIGDFLGGVIGGIGRGILGAGILGGGYHHYGYGRGWSPFSHGPMGLNLGWGQSSWGQPGWGQQGWGQSGWEQPGWGHYHHRRMNYSPWNQYDPDMDNYGAYSGGYGYRQQNQYWRGY